MAPRLSKVLIEVRKTVPSLLARSTPSTGQSTQTARRRSTPTLLGIGVVAFVLILLGGSLAVMLGGRAGPTPTLTLSSAVIMMPTLPIATGATPSATETSNLETHAALTFAAITNMMANATLSSNAHLAKNILDAGRGYLKARLVAKAANAGRELVLVNPAFTSKTCSQCGALFTDFSLSMRWVYWRLRYLEP